MNKTNKILSVVFGLLIFVFLIHIGSTLGQRAKLDFSEEGLYTLSDGSKNILKKLNTPLKMKLYYSKTSANKGTEGIRAFNSYFEYVRDMLKEYVSHSRNNLTLEIIDPRPDTIEEEEAQGYGLKKFHITDTESYFFGLAVINDSGGESVIEFFDPQDQEKLEYEITKIIYQSLNRTKKTVGLISSLEVLQEDLSPYVAQMMRMQGKAPPESWLFTRMIKEFYNLKKIPLDSESITGVDILLIVHPKELSEQLTFAIDQYVLKGGSVVLLVDPFSIADNSGHPNSMAQGENSKASNLSKLMEQWNIRMKPDSYAGDKYLAGAGRMSPNMPSQRLIAVVNCDQRCTAPHKDVISSGLNTNMFVYPGALDILDKGKKEISITPLVTTTDKGNTYNASTQLLRNPQALWAKFSEGSGVNLGVKILGKFNSAFPDGVKVTLNEDKEAKKKTKTKMLTGLKESSEPGAIVVFSDVDFIFDQFAFKKNIFGVSLANDNASLLLNSIETLSGDKDLLSVRSKGRFTRDFDIIDEIEFEAEKKTQQKVTLINNNIREVEQELRKLGQQANEGNVALLRNVGIEKKKSLAKKVAELKRELRDVKRQGREQIEIIGKRLQYANTLVVPLLLLIFGVVYNRRRKAKVKKQGEL